MTTATTAATNSANSKTSFTTTSASPTSTITAATIAKTTTNTDKKYRNYLIQASASSLGDKKMPTPATQMVGRFTTAVAAVRKNPGRRAYLFNLSLAPTIGHHLTDLSEAVQKAI